MSPEDVRRLDALREQRKLRLARVDGLGPPDRVSRAALALHYLRTGMTQAERAASAAVEVTMSGVPESG